MSHKLEVGERRSFASHYTLTTGLCNISVCIHCTAIAAAAAAAADDDDDDMLMMLISESSSSCLRPDSESPRRDRSRSVIELVSQYLPHYLYLSLSVCMSLCLCLCLCVSLSLSLSTKIATWATVFGSLFLN